MKKLVLAAVALLTCAAPLHAQDRWPSRPVKLMVPFAAGGNTDAVARIAAHHLQIVADMARDPAVAKQMANFGSVAVANTPAEFAKMLRDETAQWANLVKEIGKN